MDKYIYLPLEIKSRDLEGRIILASYFAERNYKVIVFYKGHMDQILKFYPKGIYFHYGIVTNYLKIIQKVKELGHTVVAWDEEGFVFPSDDEHVNNRIDLKVYNELEKYFLWGEHQEKLLKRKTHEISKTKKVGHPRLDLLREEFRPYLSIEAEKIKKKYGKFILLNTKFNSNHFLGKKQAVNRLTKGDYFGGDDKFKKYHINKMEYNGKNFNFYASLIPKLSKKFKGYKIIIRPHPSENFKTWDNICEEHQLKNVYVIHEGSVLQWLIAADIMIHNGCTTGVESFALGKPSILYKPVIDKQFDIYLIEQLSREINNEKDLLNLIENVLLGGGMLFSNEQQHENISILNKYLANINGNSASQEIYNEIERTDFNMYKINYKSHVQFKMNMLFKGFKLFIRKIFPRKGFIKKDYNYLMHKISIISLNELKETLKNLNDTTGLYPNAKIRKLADNIFCFYKKNNV